MRYTGMHLVVYALKTFGIYVLYAKCIESRKFDMAKDAIYFMWIPFILFVWNQHGSRLLMPQNFIVLRYLLLYFIYQDVLFWVQALTEVVNEK